MQPTSQQLSIRRIIGLGLSLGALFNLVISLPFYLMFVQKGEDTAGFLFAFLILPMLVLYFVLTLFTCRKLGAKNPVLISILNVLVLVVFFIGDAALRLNQSSHPALVVIVGSWILPLFVTTSLELPAHYGQGRNKSVISFVLVMAVLIGSILAVNHTALGKARTNRVQTYAAIDFPIYYLSADPSSDKTLATLRTSPFNSGRMVTFFPRQGESFSETKYSGKAPTADCGTEYGQDPSLPTTWECTVIHQTSAYTLYQERLTYSNPDVAEPYGYSYFAIFNNQTVVWYGLGIYDLPTTSDDISKVTGLYDSLKPVSLQSPTMTKILGNKEY